MNALDDIEKALRLMRDRGAEMERFETTLSSIELALSEIVAMMEAEAKKPDKEVEQINFSPLIEAMKSIKATAPVTVQAAPAKPPDVVVHVPQAPAPNVVVNDWQTLKISIDRGGDNFGPMKSFTISKVK